MAKKDRNGERKTREQRRSKNFRIPELGYYLIVTDTQGTERCYFEGLYASLPAESKSKIVIKVVETKTVDLIDKYLELTAYDAQYRTPWIVFDRDQVPNFDAIVDGAKNKDIYVGWSNPCFEIWMYAYYGSMPAIQESWTCCSKFGEIYKNKTGQEYDKADKDIYRRIVETGDEDKALKIAQQKLEQAIRNGYEKPSEMVPCTTVHELVGEIRNKVSVKSDAGYTIT